MIAKGARFGRYVVEEPLGSGGMGAVYRARHVDLDREVALKVLNADLAQSASHVERFMIEARSAASLSHPNIADVTDVGEVEGVPYLVMEHLKGQTLAARLSQVRRLSPEHIASLVLPLVSAVATAHRAGIIHRDIKPENIFLADDARGGTRPVLLDFGISKRLRAPVDKGLTEVGQLMGTPYYMSPEQIQMSSKIDGRADQYSMGVVLYELATGMVPFRSDDSLYLLLAEIMHGRPERPSQIDRGIPHAFERVILRAMSRVAADRYASMDDLGGALLPFASPEAQAIWATEFGASAAHSPPTSLPPPPSEPLSPQSAAPGSSAVPLSASDLRAFPVLESCTDAELETFLIAVGGHRWAPGARLCEQGEQATQCFMVLSGELEVVLTSGGRPRTLNVIGPGEFVGQMALVEDATRSASVVAKTDAVVLSIGREVFHRLVSSGSPIAARLQLQLAVSGIRQLRSATRRLSTLIERRAARRAGADPEADKQAERLERLRAAIAEWSVGVDSLRGRP